MKIDDDFFIKEGETFRNKYPFYYFGEFIKGIPYLVLYVPVRIRTINQQIIIN